MTVDLSIPHHFLGKQSAYVAVLVASVACVGLWVLVFVYDFGAGTRQSGKLQFLSFATLLTSPLWVSYAARSWSNRNKPMIEVTSAGLIDRRKMRSPLAWKNVLRIQARKNHIGLHAMDLVVLEVDDAEILKQSFTLDTKITRLLTFKKGTELIIQPGIASKFSTFWTVLNAFWNEHQRT